MKRFYEALVGQKKAQVGGAPPLPTCWRVLGQNSVWDFTLSCKSCWSLSTPGVVTKQAVTVVWIWRGRHVVLKRPHPPFST